MRRRHFFTTAAQPPVSGETYRSEYYSPHEGDSYRHITNRTGQIFPVKTICQMARARGIEVVVDGAHAFGQFAIQHEDLDCDYYGNSLHKWVLASIGATMLYVRKNTIANIWPMIATPDSMRENIANLKRFAAAVAERASPGSRSQNPEQRRSRAVPRHRIYQRGWDGCA